MVEWITVCSANVDFQLDHFMKVMDLWMNEPESVSKPILRSDILSMHDLENSRIIKRRLSPRNPRDQAIIQSVITTKSDNYCKVLHSIESDQSLPSYYPRVIEFSYIYHENSVRLEVLPLDSLDEKAVKVFQFLFKKLLKFGNGFLNGYEKRVHHDVIVPKVQYQDLYLNLKAKYGHWVSKWTEATDPSKHVFEDIAIATWLICLWQHDKSQRFVDLGCGNGFLTFILSQEGYSGYGVDMTRRNLWNEFHGADLRGKSYDIMKEETLNPTKLILQDADWIIGNHPDELTLWIPIIAARSISKFVIIPCCFHDLCGRKASDYDEKLGRYESYLIKVENFCRLCNFIPEKEVLRIPSTKNKAILCRERINSNWKVEDLEAITSSIAFTPRKSDKEKNELLKAKKIAKVRS